MMWVMSQTHARVRTAKPAPYMKQLCKHFGHKVPAEWTETDGSITFEYAVCRFSVEDAVLVLTVEAPDDEAAQRMAGVMGSHLERFGKRDELSVSWQ
jgi:hypothetical protein